MKNKRTTEHFVCEVHGSDHYLTFTSRLADERRWDTLQIQINMVAEHGFFSRLRSAVRYLFHPERSPLYPPFTFQERDISRLKGFLRSYTDQHRRLQKQ